jgi:hypothetical protein
MSFPDPLLTLSPVNLIAGATAPVQLTSALQALSTNTGVLFVNNGRVILVVSVGSTATTATSQIGVTIQGQAVAGVSSGALTTNAISFLGPWPVQFDRTDGSFDVEVDFSSSTNVSVALINVPGVV